MRLSLALLIMSGLAIPAASAAQDHSASVPGERDGVSWHILDDGEEAATFVAVVARNGDIARLSSMVVFKELVAAADGSTYDAFSEAIAVHCPTKAFRLEDYRSAANGVSNPPPLFRLPFDPADTDPRSFVQKTPAGSLRHDQLSVACGERALPAKPVTDPYRWARERFRKAVIRP